MSRPIALERSLSQHPAIYDPDDTRNDVPITPCTVISALAKIITDYVTALFQYIARFFTQSASTSTSLSATVIPIAGSHRDSGFLRAFFSKYGYTAQDVHSRDTEELLKDITQNLIYELVMDDFIHSFDRRTLTSLALPEDCIETLRHSFDQLSRSDKSYVRLKFRDRDDNVLTIISHPGENFLVEADAVVVRLCDEGCFAGFVLSTLSGFRV